MADSVVINNVTIEPPNKNDFIRITQGFGIFIYLPMEELVRQCNQWHRERIHNRIRSARKTKGELK